MVIDRRYNKPVGSPNRWKARLVRAQRQVRENPFSKNYAKPKLAKPIWVAVFFRCSVKMVTELIYGGPEKFNQSKGV
jgi:hypothetical protein